MMTKAERFATIYNGLDVLEQGIPYLAIHCPEAERRAANTLFQVITSMRNLLHAEEELDCPFVDTVAAVDPLLDEIQRLISPDPERGS